MTATYEQAREALLYVDADCARDEWIAVGMAIHCEFPGDDGWRLWADWSATAGDRFDERAAIADWRSFKPGATTIATLFGKAKQAGWDGPHAEHGASPPPPKRPPKPAAPPAPERDYPPAAEVKRLLDRCYGPGDDQAASAWLKMRHLDAETAAAECFVLPADAVGKTPAWMPTQRLSRRGREIPGRLLIPLFDHAGSLRSVSCRVIDQGDDDGPSTLRFKASRPKGYKAGGLVMANAAAQTLLVAGLTCASVIITEGEPDFLTRCQTDPQTPVFGIYSGSWQQEHADRVPDGCAVYIETDRDQQGDKYADKIARTLGSRCRLFRTATDAPQGDINDLMMRGTLRPPAEQSVPYDPDPQEPETRPAADHAAPDQREPDGPPEICHQWQLSAAMRKINAVLGWRNVAIITAGSVKHGFEPLFLTPGDAALARLAWRRGADDRERLEIERMSLPQVAGFLTREFTWTTYDDKGERKNRDPKRSCVEQVWGDAASAPSPFPSIHAVIGTPVFGRAATLIATRGYHESEHLWFEPAPELVDLPPVPAAPSQRFVERARELLLDALVDFAFTGPAERATAVAAILLPFVRRMIPGPTPIHLLEAPVQGSGKSLLARIISIIVTGARTPPIVLNDNMEETQKLLGAEVSRGRPIIMFDNLDTTRTPLKSPALSMIATETTPSMRILGQSKMVDMPNNALYIATGNNVRLDHDLIRRFVRCRLDPGSERPWMRDPKSFRHPDIESWVLEHRARLVWSALVLCQAWIAAGQPDAGKTLGSYEHWSRVIGGIMHHAGVPGFLENAEAFYGFNDAETDAWPPFVTAWWASTRDYPTAVKDLNFLCERHDLMLATRGDKSELSQMQRLGRALQATHERIIDGHKVCALKDSTTKGWKYYLEQVGEAPQAAAQAPTTTTAVPDGWWCDVNGNPVEPEDDDV